jgi:asparagine synthase (glutamine-hydrolysing)
MCGIAGIVFPEPNTEREVLKSMCDAIAHRGPDAEGQLYLPKLHFGHRRLSIIDLSEAAHQPMEDVTGNYVIVFNGEIYNYLEVRDELKLLGYRFSSNSDTEVILNAYDKWKEDCLSRFNGMFAFAIWDKQREQLFVARDRFGKKPFYYSILNGGGVCFASECRALLNHPQVSSVIDVEALNVYLALGYVMAPRSVYRDIKKLPAAHWMKVSEGGKRLEMKQYWDYASFLRKEKIRHVKTAQEGILHHLKKAIQYRLISDVPVGAFLSGGVDSSSVVAGIRHIHNDDLKTFSIGFASESYSELEEARFAAKLFDTVHHDKLLGMSYNDNLLHQVINSFDEPFADNSMIPMLEVSELASRKIKVVLTGDGADEMFGGYVTYRADYIFNTYKYIPGPLRKMAALLFKNRDIREKQKIGLQYKLRQFTQGATGDLPKAHYSWRLHFPPEMRVNILGEKYRELVYDTDPEKEVRKHFRNVEDLNWLDQALYVDAMTWLTDDILVKVDRTTMRYGLEARAPYLDVNFVEFAATIAPELKYDGKETKKILKSALKEWLPDEILYRKKSGFNAPVGSWIGNAEGDEFRTFNKYVYNQKINGATKKAK